MNNSQPTPLHPLLQTLIDRLVSTGAGEVVVAPDGHVFFSPGVSVKCIRGAVDMKKEGQEAGVRIITRKVSRRAKRSKYAGMPCYQIYALPVLIKNAGTMTDAERLNMQLNAQALRMAHAVERDPEQLAAYRKQLTVSPLPYERIPAVRLSRTRGIRLVCRTRGIRLVCSGLVRARSA